MEDIKKLNDLDYCYASLELLKMLEKNSYSRNEALREFQKKVAKQQSLVISGISLIFPLVIWGYFLLSGGIENILSVNGFFSKLGVNLVGMLMISSFIFLLGYMFLNSLWNSSILRPLKRLSENKLRNNLKMEVRAINSKSELTIAEGVFHEERIPELFLCSEILPLIIRYFETHQAHSMKEAIYYLELELINTGHYDNLVPNITLLQKEKDCIANQEKYLNKIMGER